MKPIEFKPSGVLWRLATYYGPFSEWYLLHGHADVCSFTRGVLIGAFKVLLILLCAGVGAALVGDTVGWLAAMIFSQATIDPNQAAIIVIAVLIAAIVIAAAIGVWYGLVAAIDVYKRRKPAEYQPPSQLRVMYSAWKEKYCVPVTFKAED